MLTDYGFRDYFITTKLNEELRKNVALELESVQAPIAYHEVVREFVPGNIIIGKSITKEPVMISSINNVGRNMTVEGYIESVSLLERENINIITLNINDNSKA